MRFLLRCRGVCASHFTPVCIFYSPSGLYKANSLVGVIKQYKLVASSRKTAKKDNHEPDAAK